MALSERHVMIDIETMGTRAGCSVVSLGAVVFSAAKTKVSDKTFYREFDIYAQELDHGLTIDPNTYAWWQDQSEHAREALEGLDDLREGLIDFAKWLPKDAKVWGNGPTFDITILEHCYETVGVEIPWKFWNIRDCRTALQLHNDVRGFTHRTLADLLPRDSVAHNALEDAQHQAAAICTIWNNLAK